MNFGWLIIFALFTFAASTLYFYLFSRKQEKFMQYWGISWLAYSCSLLCLLCYFNYPNELFLELRKVIDMFNLLLLLFGSYSFMHIKIPTYWYRFSLYLLLLAIICVIYNFELLSFYLPISIYQLIITIFICYNIWKRWNIILSERIIALIIFLFWGISKSIISIIEVFTNITQNFYITEILLSNIVNFCILVIYIVHTQKENNLANDLYKTIVKNSKDAIFYYKLYPYEAFEYISPSIKDITGFAPTAFYENPKLFLNLTDERHSEEMLEIFSSKHPCKDTAVIEMYNKDGKPFWGEFTCTMINDSKNSPIAIEGTFRDITRIKSVELEQINATKSRNNLLSYISHELRTPITSIAGFLTALNDGTMSSDEEKKEAMDIITTKALTLKKLIDDLDQLTKLETHQFTFNFMSYTTGDVTEMLINGSLSDAKSAGFNVSMDYDINTLNKYWIVIDYDRINQVFSNLVSNAIKYSNKEKNLIFKFKIDEAEENFLVSVEDTGIGIKDENIPHIFDRFFRAKDNNKTSAEGRGLGLTLCKDIMLAHQGDIFAESIYGYGSTFIFIIPLYKEV